MFVRLLHASGAQCLFFDLFETQESLALFSCSLVCYASLALFILWYVFCLLRKNFAHCLFSGLFVTQESRALFVLWIVCLFRKSLAHGLFSGLFVCNARVSCTVRSLDCLFVTQESRALSVLWIVIQESRALSVLWIVCLFRKVLEHCLFSGLFVCYARVLRTVCSPRVSCTVCSLDCLFVT